MHWSDLVTFLKSMPRPLRIHFKRSALLAQQLKDVDEKRDRTKSDQRRGWAIKKAQMQNGQGNSPRLISLKELESKYTLDDKKKTLSMDERIQALFEALKVDKLDEEHLVIRVLQELYTTEVSYVNDLRALIHNYMIPLRRTTRKRRKCKDMEDQTSILCEHGLIRSTCNKMSSESVPLMEAKHVKTVFMNCETLVKVNIELLQAIQHGLNKLKPDASISELVGVYVPAFIKITPFFSLYALYCHQYPDASNALSSAGQSTLELKTFLEDR